MIKFVTHNVFIAMTVCASAFAIFSCSTHQPSPGETTAAQPPKEWPEKMRQLKSVLTDLLPYIANEKRFADPANAAKIEKDTSDLKSLAHDLKTGAMPNNDPSMRVVSELFDDDLGRALASLKSGNRDYARRILGDTTSYCIQCHTQTNNGPEFPRLTLDFEMKDLKPLDRAEFLAATRQFEPALKAYRQVLSEGDLAKSDSFAYEGAAREAIAISVRVHKDPKEALGIVSAIDKNHDTTPAFKKIAASWKTSLEAWKKEKTHRLGRHDDPSLRELKEAEALIARAQKNQSAPLDDSQDILYERAASLLHDLLQRPNRTDELSARALYLSGLASEATRDTSFWGMHEGYYEQCIRLRPQSEQAKQCFGRLKDSVLMGYSGSGGTVVPGAVQRRLDTFHDQAFGVSNNEPAPSEVQ